MVRSRYLYQIAKKYFQPGSLEIGFALFTLADCNLTLDYNLDEKDPNDIEEYD